MGLNYENFTDTEWSWILLIERLRGLTLDEIKTFIGCKDNDLIDHWCKTRSYKQAVRCSNMPVKERVYLYMDMALRNEDPFFTPAVLADIFESNEECVQREVEQWHRDVESHRHFPWECGFGMNGHGCGVRGSWFNPIMENGLCLQCNADRNDWPIELWRTNGQMVALLFEWGLIESEMIAERYTT